MIAAIQYKLTSASILPLEVQRQEKVIKNARLTQIEQDLETIAKQFILNKSGIETFVQSKLDKLFRLRITCLNELIANHQQTDDIEAHLSTLLKAFETNTRFTYLHKNILVALKTNLQGIQPWMPQQEVITGIDFADWQPIPKQSLQSFLNLIRLSALPFDFRLYQTWMIASLQIEFVVLTALVIHEKHLPIEDAKINQLAVFIACAAQTFGHISEQIGRSVNPNNAPLKQHRLFFDDLEDELDESPFNIQHILENHTIQWENLPLVQRLFENAPFDDMLKSLTP
jgi:hypothetical protein